MICACIPPYISIVHISMVICICFLYTHIHIAIHFMLNIKCLSCTIILILPHKFKERRKCDFGFDVKFSESDYAKGLSKSVCNLQTCWIFIFLNMTLSQTKWISRSMCFVLAWRMILCDKSTTLRLSQMTVGGRNGTTNSVRKDSK